MLSIIFYNVFLGLMVQENVALIKEINELRKEVKYLADPPPPKYFFFSFCFSSQHTVLLFCFTKSLCFLFIIFLLFDLCLIFHFDFV
jgi:hypothetical protein